MQCLHNDLLQVDETLNTKYSLRGRGRGRGQYGMGMGRGRGSGDQYPSDRSHRSYEQHERPDRLHAPRDRPDRPYEPRDRPDRPFDRPDRPDRSYEQPGQRGLPPHLQNRLSERAGPRGPPPDAEMPAQVAACAVSGKYSKHVRACPETGDRHAALQVYTAVHRGPHGCVSDSNAHLVVRWNAHLAKHLQAPGRDRFAAPKVMSAVVVNGQARMPTQDAVRSLRSQT